MRIGFVTDEISPNVEDAIRIGISWGVNHYELRVVGEKRIPALSQKQIEQILNLKNKYGVKFTALSPGSFKYNLNEKAKLKHDLEEILPETFRLAKILGTKVVIIFSFVKSADEETVVKILKKVANSAHRNKLILAIENEPGFWCDSGKNTARILQKVNSPALKANWDPANAIGSGENPYPEGYESLKKWIVNVHVKDTKTNTLHECVPVGAGKVDWRGHLSAFQKDNVIKTITIETHCLPLVEKSRQNLKIVRNLLEKRF